MAQSDDGLEPEYSAEVTRLLNRAQSGAPEAAAALLPLIYDRLRAMAREKMRQERPDHTLQATALVHEAYLRLVAPNSDGAAPPWQGRWHFFAAAAEAMRRILVEAARRRGRIKRGGTARRVNLDDLDITIDEPPEDLLALDEALEDFAREHPDEARLVQLRYFAGLTRDEAAEALGISPATAGRDWAYARAWLYRRMTESD